MKQVTLIGRFHVHKHKGRWIVTHRNAHGDHCISTHGSHATAVAAAKRYDESARRCYREYRALLSVLD